MSLLGVFIAIYYFQPEDVQNVVEKLYHEILNKECQLNVEYGGDYVTLLIPETKEDVGQSLVSQGFLLAESRREPRLQKLSSNYQNAQEKAKASRVSLFNLLFFSCALGMLFTA